MNFDKKVAEHFTDGALNFLLAVEFSEVWILGVPGATVEHVGSEPVGQAPVEDLQLGVFVGIPKTQFYKIRF